MLERIYQKYLVIVLPLANTCPQAISKDFSGSPVISEPYVYKQKPNTLNTYWTMIFQEIFS
jgi:hypothetical protein